MTNEPLVVCEADVHATWEPHKKSWLCLNPRPVEASAPAAPPTFHEWWDKVGHSYSDVYDAAAKAWHVAIAAPEDQTQAAPDAELRELRVRRDAKMEIIEALKKSDVLSWQDAGRFLEKGIVDMNQRIATREKELEGRTHAK